jgi:hypothetical protein
MLKVDHQEQADESVAKQVSMKRWPYPLPQHHSHFVALRNGQLMLHQW